MPPEGDATTEEAAAAVSSTEPAQAAPAAGSASEDGGGASAGTGKADIPAAPAASSDPADAGKQGGAEEWDGTLTAEGVDDIDQTMLTEFGTVAKDLGIGKDNAQKLVGFYADQVKRQTDEMVADHTKAVTEQLEAWDTELKADKEFGGDNHKATIADAQYAVDKFGDPELKKFLDDSNGGRHPGLVKMLARIGAASRDDKGDGGGGDPSGGGEQVSALRKLYKTKRAQA